MTKHRLYFISVALFLLVSYFDFSFAMNDTDGVIGRGLFPLNTSGTSLRLVSESIEITLNSAGIHTKRSYEVQNTGRRGAFSFGTMCGYNTLSINTDRCGKIVENGKYLSVTIDTSYLVDEGSHVSVKKINISEVTEILKHLDGTIVSHIWSSFELEFDENETKRLEIMYFAPIDPKYFKRHVLRDLFLYTEKFWDSEFATDVELRLAIEGFNIPLEYLTPKGRYSQYSIPPDSEEEGVIVWRFKDYRPNREKYSYTLRLLHPSSINFDSLCLAYEQATGKSICEKMSDSY